MVWTAEIVADSIAPSGVRLTTFKLVYPRFIHAEFMTHRMFSRNASSSRAIPVLKMLRDIEARPAEPCHWGANEKGMQATGELSPELTKTAKKIWQRACSNAVEVCRELEDIGAHKQVANRLNEPFQHMSVVCTGISSAYGNFFALRCHTDAEPNIQKLAWAMADAYQESQAVEKNEGQWHLPFILDQEALDHTEFELIKASVARCARSSYKNHDGTTPDMGKDSVLYDRLVKGDRAVWEPGHMSPTEHQAQALSSEISSGNLKGWLQYRKTLPRELMTFDYDDACRRWR